MLFQGQEFAASAPFLYFADHSPELAKLVQAGRAEFLAQFRSLADPRMARRARRRRTTRRTFERCKLDFAERETHAESVPAHQGPAPAAAGGPGLPGPEAAAAWTGRCSASRRSCCGSSADDGLDRLLVVNFGRDLHLLTCPEPLLAPPEGMRWRTVLSTEDPEYGGCGTPAVDTETEGWRVLGEAAVVLAPEPYVRGEVVPQHGRLGGGTRRIVY